MRNEKQLHLTLPEPTPAKPCNTTMYQAGTAYVHTPDGERFVWLDLTRPYRQKVMTAIEPIEGSL